jgi:hypothetical protein
MPGAEPERTKPSQVTVYGNERRRGRWHNFFGRIIAPAAGFLKIITMTTTKKQPRKKAAAKTATKTATKTAAKKSGKKKWSADVTQHSDALDLKKGVFTSSDPKKVAQSLERSAEKSKRKKSTSYQSAMSMLNFYINRAGKNLPAGKKKVLTKAKDELKAMHAKEKDSEKRVGRNR